MKSKKILISSCLLGQIVRYDGKSSPCTHPVLQMWQAQNRFVPICPEVAAGLTVPRSPCEIKGPGDGRAVLAGKAQVVTQAGTLCSHAFLTGAQTALSLAIQHKITIAILKASSPSCGNHFIYDGSFQGTRVAGMGVTAALLAQHGIKIFNETELEAALSYFNDSLE